MPAGSPTPSQRTPAAPAGVPSAPGAALAYLRDAEQAAAAALLDGFRALPPPWPSSWPASRRPRRPTFPSSTRWPPDERPVQPGPGHIGALQAALAAEHAAVYGYGVVGAYLTGSSRATATADWLAHQVTRDTLEGMLRSRGAQPVAAAVGYQLPIAVRTPAEAAQLAVILEDRVATACIGLVALAAIAIRQFGAGQLQASRCARQPGGAAQWPSPGLPASSLARARQV